MLLVSLNRANFCAALLILHIYIYTIAHIYYDDMVHFFVQQEVKTASDPVTLIIIDRVHFVCHAHV